MFKKIISLLSKVSILSDMRMPKENDNTHRTYCAYLPLMSACRPDWNKKTLERKAFHKAVLHDILEV